MNILAINSSHRGRKGFTQALLDRIRTGAEAAGAGFETVALAEMRINRCLGCEACHTESRHLRCVYEDKDDIAAIFDQIRAADLIIYATPIYVFSMSGLMKTFLDRINSTGDIHIPTVSRYGLVFHDIDASVCSKPFALLTVCGNIENETVKNAVSYFKTYSKFMDAPVAGIITRKSSFLLERKSEADLPQKADVLRAFEEAGRELAVSGRISRKTRKRTERSVIEIPTVVRALMKIRPIKGPLMREGLKRRPVEFE